MQIVKKEDESDYQFLDKAGKDFLEELLVTDIRIDANAHKTICYLTILQPSVDIKIDEVEIRFDFESFLGTCSVKELKKYRDMIAEKLPET